LNVVLEEDFEQVLADTGLDEEWDRKATEGSTVSAKEVES
jgi:hypothetical protein